MTARSPHSKKALPHARVRDDRVARQRSGSARESQHGLSPGHRRHLLRLRRLARTARQGDAAAVRRPSCRRRGRKRGANDRGADGACRCAAQAIPQRGGDPLRGRRGHPADPRYPRGAGVCADFGADRRRLPRLAVVRCRNQRNAGEGLARDHAGNGRRRLKTDAQSGSDPGREEMRGDVGAFATPSA